MFVVKLKSIKAHSQRSADSAVDCINAEIVFFSIALHQCNHLPHAAASNAASTVNEL